MDFATREFFSGSCALICGYKCTEFETLTCAFVVEHAKISGIFSIFIFLFFFYVVDVCFPAIRFRMQNGAADRIRSRELAVETRRLID